MDAIGHQSSAPITYLLHRTSYDARSLLMMFGGGLVEGAEGTVIYLSTQVQTY